MTIWPPFVCICVGGKCLPLPFVVRAVHLLRASLQGQISPRTWRPSSNPVWHSWRVSLVLLPLFSPPCEVPPSMISRRKCFERPQINISGLLQGLKWRCERCTTFFVLIRLILIFVSDFGVRGRSRSQSWVGGASYLICRSRCLHSSVCSCSRRSFWMTLSGKQKKV